MKKKSYRQFMNRNGLRRLVATLLPVILPVLTAAQTNDLSPSTSPTSSPPYPPPVLPSPSPLDSPCDHVIFAQICVWKCRKHQDIERFLECAGVCMDTLFGRSSFPPEGGIPDSWLSKVQRKLVWICLKGKEKSMP